MRAETVQLVRQACRSNRSLSSSGNKRHTVSHLVSEGLPASGVNPSCRASSTVLGTSQNRSKIFDMCLLFKLSVPQALKA